MIWIDHVTTSLIGRQHIVLGEDACGRVTISNCKIDGSTDWSATCDGHHYWAMYFTGSQDVSSPRPSPPPHPENEIMASPFTSLNKRIYTQIIAVWFSG